MLDADAERLEVSRPEARYTQLEVDGLEQHECPHQRLVVAGPARALHRPLGPASRLPGSLLLHADQCGEVVQPHPGAPRHGVVGVTEETSCPGDDAQRAGERPHAQVPGRLVGQQVGCRHRVVHEPRRPPVGVDRRLEHPSELTQVPDGLPQPGAVVVRDAREATARLDRDLEVVRGIRVGVRAPGQLAGHLRVLPGAVGVAGPREVHQQGGGVGVEVGADVLEHGTGRAVDAGAHPEGQSLVGRVADEAVAEPEPGPRRRPRRTTRAPRGSPRRGRARRTRRVCSRTSRRKLRPSTAQ